MKATLVKGNGLEIKLRAGRAPKDKEKAILPALIYMSDKQEFVHGIGVALGWWDWFLSVHFIWIRKDA